MGNSILKEAEEIVNGARATDYGSAKESFEKIGKITEILINEKDTAAARACKTLISVKLVRESNRHKRDNLVDLCGYAELLNRLHEEGSGEKVKLGDFEVFKIDRSAPVANLVRSWRASEGVAYKTFQCPNCENDFTFVCSDISKRQYYGFSCRHCGGDVRIDKEHIEEEV